MHYEKKNAEKSLSVIKKNYDILIITYALPGMHTSHLMFLKECLHTGLVIT